MEFDMNITERFTNGKKTSARNRAILEAMWAYMRNWYNINLDVDSGPNFIPAHIVPLLDKLQFTEQQIINELATVVEQGLAKEVYKSFCATHGAVEVESMKSKRCPEDGCGLKLVRVYTTWEPTAEFVEKCRG